MSIHKPILQLINLTKQRTFYIYRQFQFKRPSKIAIVYIWTHFSEIRQKGQLSNDNTKINFSLKGLIG